jgi:hypothetical protein
MLKRLLFVCLLLSARTAAQAQAQTQDFYGPAVQEIRIDFPQANWDDLLDSLKKNNPDSRIAGDVTVNKVRYKDAGIRYKGNSSYFRTRNETYKKLPFNIKLNLVNKTQTLKSGHNTIKLSNAFMDPSFQRDPLTYDVVRRYMPAPRCNFASVYVNNQFYGLYVNTESVDELFIKNNFGAGPGFLVKCDPDNWKRVRSQSGCPKGENASLSYLNDSPGCYDAFYEVDQPGAWEPLLKLIKTLNKNPDQIESVLNVDQTLWMLAINNILVNLDSYNGSLSHNYYLWFDSTGVAHPIIWDLNMSLGGWRRNFSFTEMPDQELIQMQPLAEINNPRRPLISQLLKNAYYRKIYLAHYRTILKDFLENGALLQRAAAIQKEIDPIVQKDSLKLYSYDSFKNSLDSTLRLGSDNIIGIRYLMTKRAEWLSKHPLMTRETPTLEAEKPTKQGTQWRFTLKAGNDAGCRLHYRTDKGSAFKTLPMFDDGTNGDLIAGDGIHTVLADAKLVKHYYFSAEYEQAASTLPTRASFEYLELK